jgi:hypothetical protein
MAFIGQAFRTKRHDTKPFDDALEIAPAGSDVWGPLDLTGCTVRFLVKDLEDNPVFSGTATVTDAVNGKVRYSPTAGQMALSEFADDEFPLTLRAEWEVTFASGIVQTIPEGKDYRKLIVGADLG